MLKAQSSKFKHTNNYDFIRFCAASLVLFSHHYTLVGDKGPEPSFLGLNTLGGLAVSIFFALSGYLITQSWFSDPHPVRFAIRRVLRIWPALIFVTLLSALALGPWLSTLSISHYFKHEAFRQFFKTIIMQPAYHLPGAFQSNALPAVNGSLWTIPYEVLCYLLIMAAGLVGILSSRHTAARAALIYILWYSLFFSPDATGKMHHTFEMIAYFMAGAFLCATRSSWQAHPGRWCASIIFIVILAWQIKWRYFSALLGISWFSVFLGQMQTPFISRFGRFGDFSYGIYLYAFPVQQSVILLTYPRTGFYGSMLLAFAITFVLATFSWYLVEKPALAFKPRSQPISNTPYNTVISWQTFFSIIKNKKEQIPALTKSGAMALFRYATIPLFIVAASAVAASFWRIQAFTPSSQQPSSLTFFSPDGYTDELAQRTHLGMVNIYSIDGLRKDLETARKNNSQLQIDFSPIFSQQRPAEHLNQHYVHEGKSYKKSFDPRPLNKVRDLPNKDQLAELLKLFIPLLKEHTQQIAAVFLIDEPYMHGISKAEMSRLAQDVRDLLEENGLQQLPLGITFSAAMFDARFAQLVDQQASQWVHDVEQYYQRLNQSTLQEDREQLTQWLDVFKEQRLTTYDLANNYYTGGGIPEGYDVIAYNLYTATLLQDAVHRKTLAWFAEQGLSRACNRFHNLDISQIRSQLSFYKDGPVEPDGLKQDRDLLNDIFLCKSESILALLKAQAPSRPYRLQLFGESSANGFLEFDSQGNIEKDQPDLLVAARVHEEVERTLRFYDRHQKDFEAGVMFFIWDDTVDGSINLHISGARSMPSVTNLVFERIGK